MTVLTFGKEALRIDAAREADRLAALIRTTVRGDFRRKGAVVGVSGGVDSAVVLALAVAALGADRVRALLLPDQDSSPESERLGRQVAAAFGVEAHKVDVTPALTALGCYEFRDAAVRRVFPDYDPARERMKIVLPGDLLGRGSLNLYSLVLVGPDGGERRRVLPIAAYMEIVAASNMKQRTRMLTLYFQAERHNYAVVGTANKNEHAQGFFVKYGDSGVDLQPIAHLFKTQVYQLARELGVPPAILARPPTTDTYSAACTQEEFYFRLPFALLDVIWYGWEHDVPAAEVAAALDLTAGQVERVYRDLQQKARTTAYLRTPPLIPAPADREA